MDGESRRFWIAFGILLSTLAICTIVTLTMTIRAHAEPLCADYKTLQAALLEKFHEVPSAAGLAAKGKAAYTVFSTPDGAGWTLVIVGVTGNSCVIATGDHWVDLSVGKGDPT